MASSGPRFCPRCGTARVGEMSFCPNCGLDLRELPDAAATSRREAAALEEAEPAVSPGSLTADRAGRRGPSIRRRLLAPGALIVGAVVVAAWLGGWGPFARQGAVTRPNSPILPAVTALPSLSLPPGFTAPPVGLAIISPADGTVVGAKEVTVIGAAPPGLRITQDISFGFDQHATADGTGHWAIRVDLSGGENQLKFRIGDDESTTQTLRVIYMPPANP